MVVIIKLVFKINSNHENALNLFQWTVKIKIKFSWHTKDSRIISALEALQSQCGPTWRRFNDSDSSSWKCGSITWCVIEGRASDTARIPHLNKHPSKRKKNLKLTACHPPTGTDWESVNNNNKKSMRNTTQSVPPNNHRESQNSWLMALGKANACSVLTVNWPLEAQGPLRNARVHLHINSFHTGSF